MSLKGLRDASRTLPWLRTQGKALLQGPELSVRQRHAAVFLAVADLEVFSQGLVQIIDLGLRASR